MFRDDADHPSGNPGSPTLSPLSFFVVYSTCAILAAGQFHRCSRLQEIDEDCGVWLSLGDTMDGDTPLIAKRKLPDNPDRGNYWISDP